MAQAVTVEGVDDDWYACENGSGTAETTSHGGVSVNNGGAFVADGAPKLPKRLQIADRRHRARER